MGWETISGVAYEVVVRWCKPMLCGTSFRGVWEGLHGSAKNAWGDDFLLKKRILVATRLKLPRRRSSGRRGLCGRLVGERMRCEAAVSTVSKSVTQSHRRGLFFCARLRSPAVMVGAARECARAYPHRARRMGKVWGQPQPSSRESQVVPSVKEFMAALGGAVLRHASRTGS